MLRHLKGNGISEIYHKNVLIATLVKRLRPYIVVGGEEGSMYRRTTSPPPHSKKRLLLWKLDRNVKNTKKKHPGTPCPPLPPHKITPMETETIKNTKKHLNKLKKGVITLSLGVIVQQQIKNQFTSKWATRFNPI